MGPWAIAAALAYFAFGTDSGRGYMRKALKAGVRVGYDAKHCAGDIVEKAKDYKDELIAEIKEEHEEHNGTTTKKKTAKASAE